MKIKLKIHNQISKNLQAKGKYNRSIKNVFIKKMHLIIKDYNIIYMYVIIIIIPCLHVQ